MAMRSPNYPAVGLGEAINMVQLLWDREKRSYAPVMVIVQAWGYSGLNGVARTKIAAVKRYGLLEENEGGDLRLSDLAMNILHNSQDSEVRLSALRQAALTPDLFRELQQTYPQASDDTLRSYLITRKGFSDTGADSCIEAFRDTQQTAKLEALDTEVSGQPAASSLVPSPSHNQQPTASVGIPVREIEKVFRWPLSRGVVAELRFIGDAKPAHLDLLKQYLDVAKGAMEIDEEEPV